LGSELKHEERERERERSWWKQQAEKGGSAAPLEAGWMDGWMDE